MCIGLPMQALHAGSTQADCAGGGRIERVDLRLVGPCAAGDWLLVFQGAARERLDAQRAAEIEAALALLAGGLAGLHDPDADPGFALPSAMSAEQLAALAGRTTPCIPERPQGLALPSPPPAGGKETWGGPASLCEDTP